MEDMLFKEALVIVGVVVLSTVLIFTYTALEKSPLQKDIPSETEGKLNSISAIKMSCSACADKEYHNKDCSIIEITTPEPITAMELGVGAIWVIENGNYRDYAQIGPGEHQIKTMNRNDQCVVLRLA